MKELNAKQTPRGLVVTLGDVLFDVSRADLKPGGQRMVDQLVAVLKEFPQRNVLVEGFAGSTGSTGSGSYNLALSGQRADAVRTALLRQGIDSARVTTRGYGSAMPVSGNETAADRPGEPPRRDRALGRQRPHRGALNGRAERTRLHAHHLALE